MSPNLGIPLWKRIASRVVFYLGVLAVFQMLDASDQSRLADYPHGDPETWTDEQLGVAPAYFGTPFVPETTLELGVVGNLDQIVPPRS